MDYEEFENLLNIAYDEPLPRLPNRVDSCPPTPRLHEEYNTKFAELDFADDFDLSNPFVSFATPQESTKYKAESSSEDNKEKKRIKAQKNLPSKFKETNNTDTCSVDKRALRAEKNRKFAKESRDRKRKYVQDLERKVEELQKTVEYYKQKLKKYELIDRRNAYTGYEIYDILAKAHKIMQEHKQPIENIEYFTTVFKKLCDESLEEEKAALKTVTREMLQILIPFPRRIAMWLAEKDVDFANPENLVKASNSIISLEQAKVLAYYKQKMHPSAKAFNESRLVTLNMTNKVRTIVKELIGCQKRIQLEYKKVNQYVTKHVTPNYRPELLEVCAKISSSLAVDPVLRNYGIESVDEIDYGIENLSLDKTKDTEMCSNSIE